MGYQYGSAFQHISANPQDRFIAPRASDLPTASMVSQGEVIFKIPVVTKTRSLDSPESGMRQEQYLRRTKDIGGEKNRRKKQLLAGYYSVQAIGPVTSDYHSQE